MVCLLYTVGTVETIVYVDCFLYVYIAYSVGIESVVTKLTELNKKQKQAI